MTSEPSKTETAQSPSVIQSMLIKSIRTFLEERIRNDLTINSIGNNPFQIMIRFSSYPNAGSVLVTRIRRIGDGTYYGNQGFIGQQTFGFAWLTHTTFDDMEFEDGLPKIVASDQLEETTRRAEEQWASSPHT